MAPRPSSTQVEVGSAEVYFAKKLANNDKKIRDKALKKLKLWISSKISSENGLGELELQKIWKGLFYCMWFSDKPLVQEELADSLSEMFHIFSPPSITGVMFYKTFCMTMGREWLGIDRLRLDKFYMLIKKMMQQFLAYLSMAEWDGKMIIDYQTFFTAMMTDTKYPDGLKMYFAENQLSSIMIVCKRIKRLVIITNVLPSLLEPYFQGFTYLNSDAVVRTIRDEILQALLTDNLKVIRDNGKKARLKIPYSLLAQCLRDLATQKNVHTKNRKNLFRFAELYQEQSDGKCSVKVKRKQGKKRGLKDEEENDHTSKEDETGTTTENHSNGAVVTVKSDKVVEKKKRKRKRDSGVDHEMESIGNEVDNESLPNFTNISDVVEADRNQESQKPKRKGKNIVKSASNKKPITPNLSSSETGEISNESLHEGGDGEDKVKLKLNFSDTTTDEEITKKAETENVDEYLLSVTTSEEKTKKKKKKIQKLDQTDDPKPVMTFVKTPPPNSFFRKALVKSEPPQKKRRNDKKAILSTPMSESNSKKVRIDISKNTAVSAKELKICPTPPFSPTRKPNKSVLKTPQDQCTKRSRAMDFF